MSVTRRRAAGRVAVRDGGVLVMRPQSGVAVRHRRREDGRSAEPGNGREFRVAA